MRWRLLHALVAHGKAGDAEIDAELRRDDTATGRRHAERARALRPTPESKATAWERAVYDDESPNAVNEAIIAGFSHPAQTALLTDYADRYLAEIDALWARRSSERALPAVAQLFPSWRIDRDTLAAVDAWLAAEHPDALRRLLVELRAERLVRPLAAREFDRSAA